MGPGSIIAGYRPEQCLIVKLDATGASGTDEILHLPAVDGYGRLICNLWYKPQWHDEWPAAQKIHHVGPDIVKDCDDISPDRERLTYLFNSFPCLIGWYPEYDLRLLNQNGIYYKPEYLIDMRDMFYEVCGRRTAADLQAASARFGYKYSCGIQWNKPNAILSILDGLMKRNKASAMAGHPAPAPESVMVF